MRCNWHTDITLTKRASTATGTHCQHHNQFNNPQSPLPCAHIWVSHIQQSPNNPFISIRPTVLSCSIVHQSIHLQFVHCCTHSEYHLPVCNPHPSVLCMELLKIVFTQLMRACGAAATMDIHVDSTATMHTHHQIVLCNPIMVLQIHVWCDQPWQLLLVSTEHVHVVRHCGAAVKLLRVGHMYKELCSLVWIPKPSIACMCTA